VDMLYKCISILNLILTTCLERSITAVVIIQFYIFTAIIISCVYFTHFFLHLSVRPLMSFILAHDLKAKIDVEKKESWCKRFSGLE